MAKDISGLSNQPNDHEKTVFNAEGQGSITLPSSEFITDAMMTRDSGDLILTTPEGQIAVIEGYFMQSTPPTLMAADGATLTPNLVNAFARAPLEFASNDSMNDATPIGAVEELSGSASVVRGDGTKESLSIGTPIYEGDIVETAADGAVNIVFMDETSMAVSENARLAVDQYSFDPQTESGTTNFSVLRGLFVFTSGLIGRDDPDDVAIETPVGSIGIRGTIIAGDINPDGQSQISVLEGAIVVKNAGGETTLSEQFESVKITDAGQTMEPLGVIAPQDLLGRFESVGEVLPSLFTVINETVGEQSQAPQQDDQPQAEEGAGEAEASAEDSKEAAQEQAAQQTIQNATETAVVQSTASEISISGEGDSAPLILGDFLGLSTTGIGDSLLNAPLNLVGDIGSLSSTTSTNPVSSTLLNLAPLRTFEPVQPPVQTAQAPAPVTPSILNLSDANAAGVSVIADGLNNKIGYSLSALGDMNDDGFDDFVFTNNIDGQNQSYFVNGNIASLSSAVSRSNPTATNTQETVIAGIGDFNGDGSKDYVIGQQSAVLGGVTNGNVSIINGSSSAVLATFDSVGAGNGNQLGSGVSMAGDFNNDGYADVIIGAPGMNNGDGAAYFIYGNPSGTITTLALGGGTNPVRIDGIGGSSESLGTNVTHLGDFNGDGYSDFAMSAPMANFGMGRVDLYYGQKTGMPTRQSWDGNVTGQALGSKLFYAGDFNGDGKSDAFVSNADSTGKIFFGGGGYKSYDFGTLTLSAAGSVGDFNADGYDDIGLALADNSGTQIYILYGKGMADLPASFDLSYLQNPNNAFAMSYNGADVMDGITAINRLGDINGDGYDDHGIGVPDANGAATGDGGVIVVYGRGAGPAGNNLVGTAGNDVLSDGGLAGRFLSGGAGTDLFQISNTNFLGIKGGGNVGGQYDTMRLMTSGLDFSGVNFEKISGIERMQFGSDNQTMTLTLENIFNLLKTSDDGILKIENGAFANTVLNIDAANNETNAGVAEIANALEEMGNVDGQNEAGGFKHFSIGGYDLYIESDTQVNIV